MMASAFWTVDSRWAITKVVRPVIRASMPRWTMASVWVSMELVASSMIMTGGSATAARGDGQQLALALGQVGAVAGQHGVVALGQAADEVVGAGSLAAAMHSSSWASRLP